MDLLGYKEWKQMFNSGLSKIWQEERKELQTAAVLLGALQLELKKVQLQIEDELGLLRKKYEEKEELQSKIQRKTLSPQNVNVLRNEKIIISEAKNVDSRNKENNLKSVIQSPDLFKPAEFANDNDSVIDLSISDEDGNINSPITNKALEASPRLNKSKKPYYRKRKKLSQDSTKKLNDTKKDIFSTPGKSDADETYVAPSQIKEIAESKYKNNEKRENLKSDSTKLLNEIDELLNVPNKKQKMFVPEPEPVVRGNARKILMKGTTCKDCINLYGSMNLPPDELQKVINKCSNHRYVHQPRDETMPGYWDLSFRDD